MILFSS